MNRVLTLLVAGIAGAWLIGPAMPARGSPEDARTQAGGTSARGMSLLNDAAGAVYGQRYRGRQYVQVSSSTGAAAVVLEVENLPGRGLVVRALPTPQISGGTVLESPVSASSFADLDAATMRLLAANYDCAVIGRGEVVGRPTTIVELRRAGSRKPAARFWIDDATRLPLQREVVDDAGRIMRASAFSSLEIGSATPMSNTQAVSAPARRSPGQPLESSRLAALRRQGWVAPTRLGHGFALLDARMTDDEVPALHLSYGDGLTVVSVFEQAGRLDTAALSDWVRQSRDGRTVRVQPGVPERVTWDGGRHVFTVVSDDHGAVDAALTGLPHQGGHRSPSVLSRLGRGFARAASWVNPFG